MMLLLSLVSALSCKPDAAGYCTKRAVTVEVSAAVTELKINTKVGQVTTVSLPSGASFVRAPVLGNAAFYQLEVLEGSISIWPKMQGEGLSRRAVRKHSRTNLQLFLPGDKILSVGLRIAAPAVEHVLVSAPDLAAAGLPKRGGAGAQESVEQLQIELQAVKKSVRAQAEQLLAEHLLGQVHCKQIFDRAMDRFLVVTARRICRMGKYLAISIETINRARGDLFRMQSASVTGSSDEDTAPSIEAQVAHEGAELPVLRFKDKARSVLLFEVSESWEAAREYAVTVKEEGGRLRKVTVKAGF